MALSSKLRKTLLIIAGILVALVVLIILFISPLTKYMIEKYDEKYTGRQIEMDWAYVNPFTGSIHFSGLKLFELKSDSIFFSLNGLSVNINVTKALNKTYEIESVTLDEPYIMVKQNKKDFNFSDLIEKFSSKDTIPVDTTKEPLHLNILDVSIKNGEFHYDEKQTPVNYFVKEFNLQSDGMYWDKDEVAVDFSFLPGVGSGSVKARFNMNMKSSDYKISTVIKKFDLTLIEQYLKDLSKYGKFRAFLDAELRAFGNFKDKKNIYANGLISLSDFHFGKNSKEDYGSFEKFVLDIKNLNPEKKLYIFDSIMLSKPFFRYEKYDSLDNIQQMFGKKGQSVKAVNDNPEKFNLVLEIADYVKLLSKNFFESYYKINKLSIINADFKYQDFSLREKFSIGLNPFTVLADSIDKNNNRFKVKLNTGIEPFGNLNVLLSMNPKTDGDFDLSYKLEKLPVAAFNPYLITYTSFPIDRGTLEFTGNWNVREQVIKSENRLLIIDPRVTKKLNRDDTKWIPLPWVMAIVRERGNVIDYQIPISGNLKDPKFHFRDVIFDVLKNVFVKPATTPYRFEVRDVERAVEKSLTVTWNTRQTVLRESQSKYVRKIANFLKDSVDANITVDPLVFEAKEKEYIMLFEAKKKYFLQAKKKGPVLSEEDSLKVEEMSVKDEGFRKYIDARQEDSMLYTIQQKAYHVVGDEIIQKRYNELLEKRKQTLLGYFKETGTDGRVKFKKITETVPYNGFSTFVMSYKGSIPEDLKKANEDLEELNSEKPRDKYEEKRKGLFGLFKKKPKTE